MNTGVYLSFWIMAFSRYMPRSEITRSYGSSAFSFLSTLHIVLHSGYINFRSQQWGESAPLPPHLLQLVLLVDFFDNGHSDWCEVIPHCSFAFHFSSNYLCRASFHVLFSHLSQVVLVKNLPPRERDQGLIPWIGKMPWRRAWQPTPLFLPGESPRTEEPGGLHSMALQSWT